MAIQLNSDALNTYRNAAFENHNAIINNDGEGIKTNGTYSGALSALTRSSTDKAANNAARTALLKALGNAFHLTGMTESDGKITFSRDFMTQLEKILGSDFKRGDFGINAAGEVTSGKPLTMRRIKAIVDKADLVGDGSFKVEVFEKKLARIQKELKIKSWDKKDFEKLSISERRMLEPFYIVSNALAFLKNKTESEKIVKLDDFYEGALEFDEADGYNENKFVYFDGEAGNYVPMKSVDDVQAYLSKRLGVLLHLEYAGFNPAEDPRSISKINDYVCGNLKLFIKHIVNSYFEAKEQGKLEEYKSFLFSPGTCLENKCQNLISFERQHLMPAADIDVRNALEAQAIADTADNGNVPPGTDKLIGDAIGLIDEADKDNQSVEWKDYAERVKNNLVGRNAQIVRLENVNGENVFVPVMENGNPVIRPLTARDIDDIGPAYMDLIMGNI